MLDLTGDQVRFLARAKLLKKESLDRKVIRFAPSRCEDHLPGSTAKQLGHLNARSIDRLPRFEAGPM
jgi:hypothetical protein